MTPVRFETAGEAVHVVDGVENARFEVRADRPVDAAAVPAESFRFPVDAGVRFAAGRIEVPQFVSLYVWARETGELVRTTTARDGASLPPGRYEIDLSNTPMKLYLRVEGAVEVRYTASATVLSFDGAPELALGARSLHERPAGTVTTTADPRDLMAAVSALGSSLKTLSPERAYPTLRGHPPEIELGDERHVPSAFEPPADDVTIGVRPTVDDAFTVATLAHYLGARVVPADGEERYVEAAGVRRPLDRGDGFAAGVRETLERQFVFDCVLRTEGMYGLHVAERETFDAAVDRDVAELYEAPLAERVAACFDLPAAALDRPSRWHLLADVGADPADAELLPFYAADLAHVRPERERERTDAVADRPAEIEGFFRGDAAARRGVALGPTRSTAATEAEDGATRSRRATRDDPGATGADADGEGSDPPQGNGAEPEAGEEAEPEAEPGAGEGAERAFAVDEVVTPPEADALNHFWSSAYFPIGAAKATPEALRRRFDASPTASDGIDVTVVCNEDAMREESDATYGFRDLVNLDVTVHYDLTTDELREVLGAETDFFHYIGHVDEAGMRCADGVLDLHTVTATGIRAFFLNACQSYEQGLALLSAGAHGGIVTVAEVYDAIATKFGRRVARLMDAGFDLLSSMNVGQDGTLAGGSYAVVGDGRYQICRPTDGMPVLYDIEGVPNSDLVDVAVLSYPTLTYGMGTVGGHYIGENMERQVPCGETRLGRIPKDGLETILAENGNPLQVNGELLWSGEITIDDL